MQNLEQDGRKKRISIKIINIIYLYIEIHAWIHICISLQQLLTTASLAEGFE